VKSPSKILVFRQSSLGDVILTLPVLDRLKESYPDCHIDFLTKTAYAPVVKAHSAVSTVFTFDQDRAFGKVASELRSQGYDILIDLQANMRSIILRITLLGTRTLRYKKRRLAREMVVRRSHLKLSVDHTVLAYQSALKPLGIEPKLSPPIMSLPDSAIQFAESLFPKELEIKQVVAFCPGARHYEKRWPDTLFREVAQRLLVNPSIAVVVFSAEDDEFAPDLGIKHPRLIVAKNLELLDTAALLSRCKIALTNDSGLMHLANAVGTPVLAIFGPTNPRLGFAPTLSGSRVICDDVFCSPCSVHGKCPCRQPQKYCFEKIIPERVLLELNQILGLGNSEASMR
jgi:lipopolysaccharide heptosyltransferase II